MQTEPASLPLLLAARTWLLDELVPHLAPEKRYDALLIASAMAIVARELEAGSAGREQERQLEVEFLRCIYPDLAEEQGRRGEHLRVLSARLARDIRAGRFDHPGPEREALRQWLCDDTVDSLKKCNPRYLELEESI